MDESAKLRGLRGLVGRVGGLSRHFGVGGVGQKNVNGFKCLAI